MILRMILHWRRGIGAYLLMTPGLLILFVLTVFPIVYCFYISMFDFSIAMPQKATFIGLANYKKILQDPYLGISLRNTIVFSIVSVSLTVSIGLGLALLVNKIPRGKTIYRTFFILPLMLTPIVTALMWKFIYHVDFGILNYFLRLFGLPQHNWLNDTSWALFSIILVDTWQWTSFVFMCFLAALELVPREPFEAASIDGASNWQEFIHITLPLLKPLILIAMVFRIVFTFKTFDIVFGLTQGGPGTATEVLSLYVWRNGFVFLKTGYGAAVAIIMAAIMGITAGIFIKYLT